MLQLKMIKQKLPLPHIGMTIWAISSPLKARMIQPLFLEVKLKENIAIHI